jgi:hypothetical protein
MTFLIVPTGVPGGTVISAVILHDPGSAGVPAGIVPPVNVRELGVVETVPPQVFSVTPTIVKGGGKGSVRLTPV